MNIKRACAKDQTIEGSEVWGAPSFSLNGKELLPQDNILRSEATNPVLFRHAKPERNELQKKEKNRLHVGKASGKTGICKSVKIGEKLVSYQFAESQAAFM
jgi:hypothetical protein